MKKPAQITLNDIAKQLNVSRVTVSKALRDHPDISSETKAKIKKLADQLGYTPNIMARSLSSQRSNIVGLVVPKISDYFYPTIIKSIYDKMYINQYEVLLTVSYEDPEREIQHLESLMSMRVDGLLISISENTNDTGIFEKVKRMGIPTVLFDRVIEGIGMSTVKIDDRRAAYDAVQHAIEKGYTQIANLACFSRIAVGRDRLEGFKDAMNEHRINIEDEWVIEGGFSKEYGYDGFMKIYQSGKLPEIIFTAGFSVALGVYTAAAEVGIKIPEDIDLIFIGDGEVNPFASRSLSHMILPVENMGEKVVEVLLDEINHPEKEPQNLILNAHLEV